MPISMITIDLPGQRVRPDTPVGDNHLEQDTDKDREPEHELWLGERVLSVSKRDAYMRYITIPERAARPFELAANIHAEDRTGDREQLMKHGWRLVDPHHVTARVTSQ